MWQEQFEIVLVEEMESRLPILSTQSGSILEVVGDAAELVQPEDSFSLAVGLQELIKNLDYRSKLGEKSGNRAVAEFNLKEFSSKITEVYQEVIE